MAADWRLSEPLKILLPFKPDPSQQDPEGWTPLHWACCRSSSSEIHALVAAGASVNEQDSQGWTPLFWSAFNADLDNVEYLLRNKAEYVTKDVHGWTALTWASVSASPERYAVVKRLIEHYQKDQNFVTRELDESPFDLADARGDSDLFKVLLAHQQELSDGIETLWSTGKFDILADNVWRTADKGESMFGIEHDFPSSSLLHCSIRDGKRTVMRVLLELGAPLNSALGRSRRSPLHWAAFKQDPLFVQDLIDAGADVTCLDCYGQTALHQAVLNGFVETARALIEAHSDVNLRRPPSQLRRRWGHHCSEQTPLMLACGLASDEPRDKRLISRGAVKPEVEVASAVEMVALLLANGADPYAKDGDNQSVMHYAIMSGQCEIVHQLLTAGAKFEGQSDRGTNLLHEAAKAQDIDLLELVIESEQDVKAIDKSGRNIFHYLALRPCHPVLPTDRLTRLIDTLVSRCGNGMLNAICEKRGFTYSMNHGDHVGDVATPMSLAFDQGNWPLAKVLHEKGAILPQGFPTHTWMIPAIAQGSIVGVRLLLELGVSPREVQWKFFPAPYREPIKENLIACQIIVKELVDAGLDINERISFTKDPSYNTILSSAAYSVDDEQYVQFLLDQGADPRIPDSSNIDCFRIAALSMRWDTLATLLRHVATSPVYSTHWTSSTRSFPEDDNVMKLCRAMRQHGEINRIWNKRTLLDLACLRRNPRLASALLSCGADPNLPEETTGFTALHQAAWNNDSTMVAILIEAGADINAKMCKWHDSNVKPTMIYQNDTWHGTALHLAAMLGQLEVVSMLIAHGADIRAETGAHGRFKVPSQGPTALHLALSTGTFYGCSRTPDLCAERMQIAELLVAKGADVRGVGDHLTQADAKKFKGYEKLWETLQNGRSRIEVAAVENLA